jgi:hypothetical protein
MADTSVLEKKETPANWSERWFRDALVFALVGVVLVFVFGVFIGQKPSVLAYHGGAKPFGRWCLSQCRW